MGLIPIERYAQKHGRNPASVRQMCGRGGLKTATKIVGRWFVDSEEPYPDGRKVSPNGPLRPERRKGTKSTGRPAAPKVIFSAPLLARAMEEAKLSGEALSRATGVSNATISNARHEQPLIVATAEKIAAALGKTVDELKAK